MMKLLEDGSATINQFDLTRYAKFQQFSISAKSGNILSE